MRVIASSDVPGFSTQCIRKSVSWKFGRNSSPRSGTASAGQREARRAANADGQRRPADERGQHARGSARLSQRASGASCACRGCAGQQQQRQRRRDRQRDDQRGQDRQHVGQRQRPEERAGQAVEEEDRQEHQHDDQAGVDDGAADFERGVEHDVERGVADSPAARFSRSRRTMFSTSMIASSTTSPSAMTRPASTIVLSVAAAQCSTSTAATSDSGMAVRLMSAVRQSNRNSDQDDDDQHAADEQRVASGCRSDRSMNVAGRKMVGSISTSVRPGRSASSAASTSRVTSSVLPPGCFSTISSRPGPSLMTASPMGGGMTRRRRRPRRPAAAARRLRRATTVRAEVARRADRRRVRARRAAGSACRRSRRPRATAASRGGAHDVVERDAVGAQPVGIDQHLELLVALAPDGDVGHAGHRHQPRPDRPQRQRRSGPAARASSTRRRSSSPGWSTTAAGG